MTAAILNARAAIRVALTAVMGWLSMVLSLSRETFVGNPSFHVMARLGSQENWSLAFMVMAVVGGIGIGLRLRAARLLCGSLVATMHGVVALCLVLANPFNTGTGTYAVLALLGYYLVWEQALETG